MRNIQKNIFYDHTLDPEYTKTTISTTPCSDGGPCAKYSACSFHRILMPSVTYNSTGYSGCSGRCFSNIYSFVDSPSFLIRFDPQLINEYYINFPERYELFFDYTIVTKYNPNINNTFPHANTYHLVPDYRFPQRFIVDDILLFFSRKSWVVLRSVTNKYYYIWVTDPDNGLYILEEVLYEDISKELVIKDELVVRDENSDRIYSFYIDDSNDEEEITLSKRDVTDNYKQYKVIDKEIIPNYSMKSDVNYLTTYIFKYSSIKDEIQFELLTDVNDIRSYHNDSRNIIDINNLVTQRTKFDSFYQKFINYLTINFSNNSSNTRGVYPGFKLYDKIHRFENMEINPDNFNKDLDFETLYAYVIRSDFKIVAKRRLQEGDSIIIYYSDKNINIQIGNRNFYDTKYLNSSDYCDLFIDTLVDGVDYYLVIAPEDFYNRCIDFVNYYRYIAFEYTDTRNFNKEDVDKNPMSKSLLEYRHPIYPSAIKYTDYTMVFKDSFDFILYDGEFDNGFLHGIVGYKTKCSGDTYVYVFFTNDEKGYVSYKSKGYDIGEYLINKVVNDPLLSMNLKTYLLTNAFIRHLTRKFNISCGEIEFLCWNRPIDLISVMKNINDNFTQETVEHHETIMDDVDKFYNSAVEVINLTNYFIDEETQQLKDMFGNTDRLNNVYTSITDLHDAEILGLVFVDLETNQQIEPKFCLISINGYQNVDQFIYKGKIQAEYTPGKHGNFVLNRHFVTAYPTSGPYQTIFYVNIKSSVEPDATIMEPGNKIPYRPFELGYSIKKKCKYPQYPIVARYQTKDKEYHIMPLNKVLTPYQEYTAFPRITTCCGGAVWYVDYFYYEVFQDSRSLTRFEGINSASSDDIVFNHKTETSNRIAPQVKFNSGKLVSDFLNLAIYTQPTGNIEYDENQLYEIATDQNTIRLDTYPHRYFVNGQYRDVVYFTTFSIENLYLHQLLVETIDFYKDNVRYMQTRKQAVLDDSFVINIDQVSHKLDDYTDLSYKKEFSIRTTYTHYAHSFIDRILFTIDTHDLLTFNYSYDKYKSDFFDKTIETQKIPLYNWNYINTTIAKHF